MSDQPEDRELEDYLHRKSALSLGYKSVYVEAPPPELDRAISARARRALRWLGPGIAASAIAIGLVLLLNSGVSKFVGAMVSAERHKKEMEAQQPVTVDIAPISSTQTSNAAIDTTSTQSVVTTDTHPVTLTREQWQAKIKALRAKGNIAAADAEQRAFDLALASDKQTNASKKR